MLANERAVVKQLRAIAALADRSLGKMRAPDLQRLWPNAWDNASRTVLAEGYRWALWFPRRGGGATQDASARSTDAGQLDFVILAWPEHQGTTGRRIFALHGLCLLSVENTMDPCEGVGDMPPPVALGARLSKAWGPTPRWASRLDWRPVSG
jgi:hypothetical protein